jgi:hypothetical protein
MGATLKRTLCLKQKDGSEVCKGEPKHFNSMDECNFEATSFNERYNTGQGAILYLKEPAFCVKQTETVDGSWIFLLALLGIGLVGVGINNCVSYLKVQFGSKSGKHDI